MARTIEEIEKGMAETALEVRAENHSLNLPFITSYADIPTEDDEVIFELKDGVNHLVKIDPINGKLTIKKSFIRNKT